MSMSLYIYVYIISMYLYKEIYISTAVSYRLYFRFSEPKYFHLKILCPLAIGELLLRLGTSDSQSFS